MIDPAASPLSFFASEMVRLRNAAGLSQPALAKRLVGLCAGRPAGRVRPLTAQPGRVR
jgi:hypothetical protein